MKILSRDFNAAEKTLFLVLGLALTGLLYYQFVYMPVQRELDTATLRRDEMASEVDTMQIRLRKLNQMEQELERIESSGSSSRMPSYNNSKAEIALLNSILEPPATERYTVAFSGLARDGDQIRRGFSLQFTTFSFDAAKSILTSLTNSEDRCLLSNLRYAINSNAENGGQVVVSVEGTFYETMVGGIPDIALPD